jgi:putative transposase
MKAKRYTEEQIIGVLKEAEAGAKTKDPCRNTGCLTLPSITGRRGTGG